MAYSFTSVVIVCIRQGRGRPHFTKYTDIDDNAVIAYVSAKSRTLADDSFACRPLHFIYISNNAFYLTQYLIQ